MWKRMWREMETEPMKSGLRQMKVANNRDLHEKTPLEEIINDWLHTKRLRVKESTYANYLHLIERHILPRLGEIVAEPKVSLFCQNPGRVRFSYRFLAAVLI